MDVTASTARAAGSGVRPINALNSTSWLPELGARTADVGQVVITWGRGAEGQLGGSSRPEGSSPKVIVGPLKGRHILQVLTPSEGFTCFAGVSSPRFGSACTSILSRLCRLILNTSPYRRHLLPIVNSGDRRSVSTAVGLEHVGGSSYAASNIGISKASPLPCRWRAAGFTRWQWSDTTRGRPARTRPGAACGSGPSPSQSSPSVSPWSLSTHDRWNSGVRGQKHCAALLG